MLVASANGCALMRELRGAPGIAARALAPARTVDLVMIEGFKHDPLPKIEVFRAADDEPPLYPDDRNIVALITDAAEPSARLPRASI